MIVHFASDWKISTLYKSILINKTKVQYFRETFLNIFESIFLLTFNHISTKSSLEGTETPAIGISTMNIVLINFQILYITSMSSRSKCNL